MRAPPAPGPWYRHRQYWIDWADRYLEGYRRTPPGGPQDAEVHAFVETAAIRAVFESNHLERAGLSLGETRRVIHQFFAPDPADALPGGRRGDYLSGLRPVLSFDGRSRPLGEVIQHVDALRSVTKDGVDAGARIAAWRGSRASAADLPRPPVLTIPQCCRLHARLADGLLHDDAGVEPGAFRADVRSTGLDLVFPGPELVPASMLAWEARSNAALYSKSRTAAEAVHAAGRISYEFVRIHPFPDFNGRMSRLLLNYAVTVFGLPFPLALRGGAKGKHRYLSSLQRADRGDCGAYEALIAMAIVEHFEEIDANLARANVPTLLSFAPQ